MRAFSGSNCSSGVQSKIQNPKSRIIHLLGLAILVLSEW